MLRKIFMSLLFLPFALGSCIDAGANTSRNGRRISFEQAMERVEDDASEIWIFSLESCPYCQKALPFVEQYIKDEREQRIYFIDRAALSDSQGKGLFLMMRDSFAQEDPAIAKGKILVPAIAALGNGKFIKAQTGFGQDRESVYGNLSLFLALI